MHLAAQLRRPIERLKSARLSTDREIRDFLSAKTNGEELLRALYAHVLEEPVPERLLAVLKP